MITLLFSIHLILNAWISNQISPYTFNGELEYLDVNTLSPTFKKMISSSRNRIGPVTRYLENKIKIYVHGDTLIEVRHDSFDEVFMVTVQIRDHKYLNNGSFEKISTTKFKDISKLPNGIAAVRSWKTIRPNVYSGKKGNTQFEVIVDPTFEFNGQVKFKGMFSTILHANHIIRKIKKSHLDFEQTTKLLSIKEKSVNCKNVMDTFNFAFP